MSSQRPRRAFSAAFKAEVVLSLLTGAKTQAELCRQHELPPTLLSQWKDAFLENAAAAFQSREQNSAEAARVADLERASFARVRTGSHHFGERHPKKGIESVEPKERQELVTALHAANPAWSKACRCGVLQVPRSSLYYACQKR